MTKATSPEKPRPRQGPFPGERWGPYTVEAELAPLRRGLTSYATGTERMFAVRCLCGAPSALRRSRLVGLDDKTTMDCPACRGAPHGSLVRTTFPPRWPDGIYGAWRLIDRTHHGGVLLWRMVCRTCGWEKFEANLRQRRIREVCKICALKARREARIRARARARAGSQIMRVELQ